VDGWMNGWMDAKAVLRVAYSSKKFGSLVLKFLALQIQLFDLDSKCYKLCKLFGISKCQFLIKL
jgi:hypothetical protein